MRLKPVDSEMLIAAGYDKRARILQVIFRTGETYRYKEVPSSAYDGLMSADSKGKYMHRYIIGHYPYERV